MCALSISKSSLCTQMIAYVTEKIEAGEMLVENDDKHIEESKFLLTKHCYYMILLLR